MIPAQFRLEDLDARLEMTRHLIKTIKQKIKASYTRVVIDKMCLMFIILVSQKCVLCYNLWQQLFCLNKYLY